MKAPDTALGIPPGVAGLVSHQSELGRSLCFTQDAFSCFHVSLPHSVGEATVCLAAGLGLGVIL